MDQRYFIVKCQNIEALKRCIESSKWACKDRVRPPHPKEILSDALTKSKVYLIFSISNCRGWHGYCEMLNAPDHSNISATQEKSYQNLEQDTQWYYFNVKWITHVCYFTGECLVPFTKTSDMLLTNGTQINMARNWQEISNEHGQTLCKLMKINCEENSLIEKMKLDELENNKPQPFIDPKLLTEVPEEIYWTTFIDKVEQTLGKVHLACPFGSQRYNLSTPDSDVDVFIVYQAKTSDILGFNPPKQTLKNSEKEECDYTILELFRYTELLVLGDPRCIETLFLHESCIKHSSPEWRKLCDINMSRLFLNRKCLDKYLRDAQGSNGINQLNKRKVGNPNNKLHQNPIKKLLYIIIRLLQNARDVVKGERINVFREDSSIERKLLLDIRHGEITFNNCQQEIKRLQQEVQEGQSQVPDNSEQVKSFLQKWLLCQRKTDFLMEINECVKNLY